MRMGEWVSERLAIMPVSEHLCLSWRATSRLTSPRSYCDYDHKLSWQIKGNLKSPVFQHFYLWMLSPRLCHLSQKLPDCA